MNFIGKLLWGMVKGLLGMKLIWILAIVVVIAVVLFLIRNIVKGSFDVAKFAGGFNIFNGSVQGKLIYYVIVFSIVAAVALGIYAKFTETTYSSDYRNLVNAQNVTIDQKQIYPDVEDNLLIGIKLFGLKIGVSMKGSAKNKTTIVNPKAKVAPVVTVKAPEAPPVPTKSNILYIIGESFAVLLLVIFGTHFITKIFKKRPMKGLGA